MKTFLKALHKVLRYGLKEDNDALLAHIYANPGDVTNHLVHADWLQDRADESTGEERAKWQEEADFRRAIAKHVQEHGRLPLTIDEDTVLPEEVNYNFIPYWYGTNHPVINGYYFTSRHSRGRREKVFNTQPPEHVALLNQMNMTYSWPTYRAMEAGLRQAFRKHA